MNVRNSMSLLSEDELNKIEDAAKKILSETGLNLQHQAMLDDMGEYGWNVDKKNEKVYFQQDMVEAFLQESEPVDWTNLPPLRIIGGAYCTRYLAPGSDTPEMSTVRNSSELTRLGDYLNNIDVMIGMGIPSDVPMKTIPLW